jgi:uracil-DNA glycosylase
MGVADEEFYDVARIAIIPMGFCFPGLDAKGGDLPPRRECAPAWRARLMAALPNLELMLLVGQYAQRWHLGTDAGRDLTSTVERWREIVARPSGPVMVPLPHPSWRNNAWIKKHPWFDTDLLPWLREAVRAKLV